MPVFMPVNFLALLQFIQFTKAWSDKKGESTHYVPKSKRYQIHHKQSIPPFHNSLKKQSSGEDMGEYLLKYNSMETKNWYALRTTYGREKKAYEYIVAHQGEAFYPTRFIQKITNGKAKLIEESRIPNIFFAYGTEKEMENFVYDNTNLPFLRFYYRQYRKGQSLYKEPMIIPERQMRSFKIICESETDDIIITHKGVEKFETGQLVKVIDGAFKGVVGRVGRYQGQQRVGLVVDGLLTVATAYIPSAFMETVEEPCKSVL